MEVTRSRSNEIEKIGNRIGGQKWIRKETNVFLVGEKKGRWKRKVRSLNLC